MYSRLLDWEETLSSDTSSSSRSSISSLSPRVLIAPKPIKVDPAVVSSVLKDLEDENSVDDNLEENIIGGRVGSTKGNAGSTQDDANSNMGDASSAKSYANSTKGDGNSAAGSTKSDTNSTSPTAQLLDEEMIAKLNEELVEVKAAISPKPKWEGAFRCTICPSVKMYDRKALNTHLNNDKHKKRLINWVEEQETLIELRSKFNKRFKEDPDAPVDKPIDDELASKVLGRHVNPERKKAADAKRAFMKKIRRA